ncbi:low molecular weight protein-tyrosine-phosphatase [Noviherbaspirillum galbum]|uniref:protein-tyrosine-phosphatase n=1 Tax=Noviherbaspirillum galbum TaxID=2709383 RepID=A0A6B3SR18_9BURK|nr:low molecular weight protein-tyrosine-phosphatase [Noviherbaspirillum galbum]NEX61765.1 low molecular weight phosphotyrosine protein phosphatase [Noviherbaspirillum galbum]
MDKMRILFVCMGNICRSPTAEGVMRHMIRHAGLDDLIDVDSAGTHGYFIGAPPDPRALVTAQRRGYDLSDLRGRLLVPDDFERFDLLLAMDFTNLDKLQTLCPSQYQSKVGMLMGYARKHKSPVVPDPYDRGPAEFERVLDYIEDACSGLLRALEHSSVVLG